MSHVPLGIVIVGGSLCGLMHGIVVARLGHHVTILEKSVNTLESQFGAGLGVADALAKFFHDYDQNQQPYHFNPPETVYVDSQGRQINTTRPGILATSWNTLYTRLKANFDGPMAKYINDAKVIDVKTTACGVLVHYTNTTDQKLVKLTGDLVIVADGSGSKTRALFAPGVSTRYVSYAAWRGTILERDMMEKTKLECQGSDRHCKIERSFFLSYTIPGEDGSLDSDKRRRNWVWYRNYAENSAEFRDILLDRNGHVHQYSLPPDTIREEVWRKQQELAVELLDPDSADLILKTEKPFFQAITEIVPERAVYGDGRVLFVGDALAVLRPLSGQGTSQAAYSAMLLRELLEGNIDMKTWEEDVLRHSKEANAVGLAREQILELGSAVVGG